MSEQTIDSVTVPDGVGRPTEGVPLTPAEIRARDAVASCELPQVVRRFGRDNDVRREDAERCMRELLRYLALCATAEPDVRYPMFGPRDGVDGAWHTFLLFTREYAAFCERIGAFIHHVPSEARVPGVPNVPDDDDEREEDERAGHRGDRGTPTNAEYEEFLQRYERMFGESPPTEFWPPFVTLADLVGDPGD